MWSRISLAFAAVVGLLAAGAAAIFSARRTGRKLERGDHSEEHLKDAERTHEIKDKQLKAAANRARDRDELERRMRSGKF